MGVKKLGPNRYRVLWHDERGVMHRRVISTTREEAEAFLAEVKIRAKRIKEGVEVRTRNPERLTVADVAKRWLKSQDDKTENRVTNHIIDKSIGKLPLDQVTAPVVLTFLEDLQPMPKTEGKQKQLGELSARTRNHVRKHLVQIFKYAMKRGLFLGDVNPVHAVETAEVQRKKLVTLTTTEIVSVLNVATYPWRGMIAAGLHGLRRGEVFGLDGEDVDLVRNEIRVVRSHDSDMTKNGTERVVPIHSGMRAALVEAKALRPVGVLFPGRDGVARRAPDNNLDRPLTAILVSAGVTRHLTFHDLRHTCATILLQAGASIAHVSKILGHSSISLTADVYGHLLTDDLHAAMGKLELPGSGAKTAPVRALKKTSGGSK